MVVDEVKNLYFLIYPRSKFGFTQNWKKFEFFVTQSNKNLKKLTLNSSK